MDILIYFLLGALCLGLPLFIVLKTQQSQKRGCGTSATAPPSATKNAETFNFFASAYSQTAGLIV